MTIMTNLDIRPFHIHFPDEDLVDLRRRIAAARFSDKETVTDQSQGVPGDGCRPSVSPRV